MAALCSAIPRLAAALLTCVLIAGAAAIPSARAGSSSPRVIVGPPPNTPGPTTAPPTAADRARCPWLNSRLPIATRVTMLMAHMTLGQKIGEMHVDPGVSGGAFAGYEGYVPAQPALCIPDLIEQDDSLGVGGPTGATQLPSATALASSWEPSLAHAYGAVNGRQHFDRGVGMTLGPGINIQRDPRWGRNYEMLSEDPLLTAEMGTADIEGIQSAHELVDVKHLAVYNQETYRNSPADDAIVSQRALHEIYLPAFQSAVTVAHAASVMCAYARVNGQYSCEDPQLMQILDDRWGFTGFLRSDGGANHSTVASVNAGLAQERGSDFWNGGLLADAVGDGQVPMSTIDDDVQRILTEMFRFDLFDHPAISGIDTFVQTPADAGFAQLVAERGTVLLRNVDGALPLNPAVTHSIAVIGADGSTAPRSAGGGGANVRPTPSVITPLSAISARAGAGVSVSSYAGDDPAAAAAAAQSAQVAIVFASQAENEGSDLTTLNLPGDQNAYISAVAAANPNTIVVLNNGGPVTMPWLPDVKAVVEGWYPGEQDGAALAAVLFGDVDPGGHLPETFPTSLKQVPANTPARWPGTHGRVSYGEGLDVGYRYDAAKRITPLFPFGFGLSYTRFSYSRLRVHADPINATSGPQGGQTVPIATVTARLANVGPVAGSDVAQLYLDDPPAAGEPPEQLEGFKEVALAPGHSTIVHFVLRGHALSWYNPRVGGWVLPTGRFRVSVGDSSARANLPLHGAFTIHGSVGARRATLSSPSSIVPGRPFTATARFINAGDVAEPAGRARLAVPTGWRVQPAATTTIVGPLSPGVTATRRFRVTPPSRAAVGPVTLRISLPTRSPAGRGGLSTYRQATVVSPVSVVAAPIVIAPPGMPVRTRVTLASHIGHRTDVVLAPRSVTGVTVLPRRLTVRLGAGARRSVAFTVTAAAGVAPGQREIGLRPSARAMALAPAALQVAEPYPSLAAAADSSGISDDSDVGSADFDGSGDSYSAQALAAAGLGPGAPVTVGSAILTWPSAAPGTPDNVLADGQTIAVAGVAGATELSIAGASSDSDLSNAGMIEYTDGTVQPFTLALSNWSAPPSVPPYQPLEAGDRTVATLPYYNDSTSRANAGAGGQDRGAVGVFGTVIRLAPGKVVADVTLPADGGTLQGAAMHVFAMGTG